MPRIPAAIAVVAMLALCIGFNVAYYPAVRRMAPACGLSMPGFGSKEAAPAASIPGSGGPVPASPAFCTAGGVCYDAGGKPLPGKAKAPSRETETRRHATEGPPRKTAGAAGEPPLIPAIRRPFPPATPGGKPAAELASARPPAAPTPLGRHASTPKRIERLPPVEEMATAGAAAFEPALPPDSIPIYPTTQVP